MKTQFYMAEELKAQINKDIFDFFLDKAEALQLNYNKSYIEWKQNQVEVKVDQSNIIIDFESLLNDWDDLYGVSVEALLGKSIDMILQGKFSNYNFAKKFNSTSFEISPMHLLTNCKRTAKRLRMHSERCQAKKK